MWGTSCGLCSRHKLIAIIKTTWSEVAPVSCFWAQAPRVWAVGVKWQLDRWLTQVKRPFRCATSDSAGPQTVCLLFWCGDSALSSRTSSLTGKEQRGRSKSSGQLDCKHKHVQSIFPRNPPQCRIHAPEVSLEFSTSHPPQAEFHQQRLNWTIHPGGSTKMSLSIQRDCSVWFGFTWIVENHLLEFVKSELHLLENICGYVIGGSPRWMNLWFPVLQRDH